MKRISSSFLALVVVLALGVTLPAAAQSANGDFSFTFDNATRSVQFDARQLGNGVRGQMTFSGTIDYADQDTDGTGDTGPSGLVSVTMSVAFDCLSVTGHRAAMSGLVTSSSVPGQVGRRGLLVVEDNGEGVNQPQPDRVTWGLYHSNSHSWLATDAELLVDTGAGLTWLASDFEREDDTPVSSVRPDAGDCHGVSLSAYALDEVIHGGGNIQVRP